MDLSELHRSVNLFDNVVTWICQSCSVYFSPFAKISKPDEASFCFPISVNQRILLFNFFVHMLPLVMINDKTVSCVKL